MIIAIVGAVLNIILDFAFVYGVEGFLEPMHIQGAAYASVIAQIVMAVLAVVYLVNKTTIPLRFSLPFHYETRRLLGMIFNLFVRTLALNLALYFATSFSTGYGKEYIAAYTIGINLWFLGAFVIDGYSSAGNVLSGKLLGGKEFDLLLQLNKKLLRYGISTGFILMVLGFVLYSFTAKIFIKEEVVISKFNQTFWLVLIMQPLCAFTFIYDSIFKGMGEMKFLRNVLTLATLGVFIPSLLLLDNLDLKLYGIWISFILWMVARGLPLHIKFRRKFLPLVEKK